MLKSIFAAAVFALAAFAAGPATTAEACYPFQGVRLVAAEAADAWMDAADVETHHQERRKTILQEIMMLQREMSVPLLTLEIQAAGLPSDRTTFRAREFSTGYPVLDALAIRGAEVRRTKDEELRALQPRAEAMLRSMVSRNQLSQEVANNMVARMDELLAQKVPAGPAARVIAYELRMEHLHKVHQQLVELLTAGPAGLERLEDPFAQGEWRFMPLAECEKPRNKRKGVVVLNIIR
jgi:uncharacterized protein YoaH (UPF0181 family)